MWVFDGWREVSKIFPSLRKIMNTIRYVGIWGFWRLFFVSMYVSVYLFIFAPIHMFSHLFYVCRLRCCIFNTLYLFSSLDFFFSPKKIEHIWNQLSIHTYICMYKNIDMVDPCLMYVCIYACMRLYSWPMYVHSDMFPPPSAHSISQESWDISNQPLLRGGMYNITVSGFASHR